MTGTFATAWRLAIFAFVLAAFSGALMRYGMFAGLPGGLQLGDVRHAHSHLMFFSWATPALMLFATVAAARAGVSFRAGPWCAVAAAVAGMLAYLPFLLSGYSLLPVGGRELPLSMMASGLNGAVWYTFAALYLVATWRHRRTPGLRFFDAAVASLLVSSIGAVLLAVAGMSGGASAREMAAFVDLFLTLFADGWFGIGVVGALLTALATVSREVASRLPAAAWLLSAALAVRSLARLAVDGYSLPRFEVLEGVAGVVAGTVWLFVAATLLVHARRPQPGAGAAAWPPDGDDAGGFDVTAWRVAVGVLVLLAVKAGVEVLIAVPAGEAIIVGLGLRIALLHAFLLGAVSLGLAASMRLLLGLASWRGVGWFAVTIAVMIAALVPLTGLWPPALGGRWTLLLAFFTSLGPAAAALVALIVNLFVDPFVNRRVSASGGPSGVAQGSLR